MPFHKDRKFDFSVDEIFEMSQQHNLLCRHFAIHLSGLVPLNQVIFTLLLLRIRKDVHLFHYLGGKALIFYFFHFCI